MNGIDAARWARLSPLLDELLDLDATARLRRLADLRAEDSGAADALEELLAGQEPIRREGFLEGDALAALGEPSLAGRSFGAYTLLRPIGAGGMGTVWLAQRNDGRFEGQAAVKLPNVGLLGSGGQQRFLREGQALARLAHPNIARLLDAGVAETGQPYLVLELVQGEPLDRWCDARALGVEARLRLFVAVCAAVGHAHANLVLHRDLKPGNILVTAEGQPKLLDFGIAKLLDATGPDGAELTQTAGRAFTPDFAAPEQVAGGDVTTATDVYALGVLLFNLLGGGHPTMRPAHTPVERLRSIGETDAQRLSTAPACSDAGQAALRAQTPARLTRRLRGDLDNIVAKALKKEPSERYASVQALADDVGRHLALLPVSARPDTLGYRTGRFMRRHRFGVAAAMATIAVLLAGVAGTAWQAREARRERDLAVYQAERAQARGNLMSLVLSATGGADRPLTQREILQRSVDAVDRRFGRNPAIAVDLLLPISGQYLTLGDVNAELATLERAAAYAEQSGDPLLVARVACDTVETELGRGRIDLAHVRLDKGLAALARSGRADPDATDCEGARAELLRTEGRLDEAITIVEGLIARAERSGNTRGNTYPKLLGQLSAWQREAGRLSAAFATLQRSLRLAEGTGETGSLDYVGLQRTVALFLMDWGEYQEARRLLDAIAVRWREGNGDQPMPDWLQASQGRVRLRQGEAADALGWFEGAAAQAGAQGRGAFAVENEVFLAMALIDLGRLEAAQASLSRAEQGAAERGTRFRLVTPALLRGRLLQAQGRAAEALQTLDTERARLTALRPVPEHALATVLRAAARAAIEAGDDEVARERATAALAVSERMAREAGRSADVGEALLLLARAQRRLGDTAAAAAAATRADTALREGLGAGYLLQQHADAAAGSSARP